MTDQLPKDPEQIREDRTQASPARWAVMAATAKPELAKLSHGRREEGFRTLAERAEVSPQTLRRAVAMLNFVEKVEVSPLMSGLNLRAVPLAGLEHIKKWNGYDAKGAASAAANLVRGASVEAIAAAESEARARLSPTLRGRALTVEYRRILTEYLSGTLSLDGYSFLKSKRLPWYYPSADCRFIRENDKHVSLVAIAMGPYETEAAYKRTLNYWMVRCVGLSRIYDKVILVAPDVKIIEVAKNWLKENGIIDGKIDIFYLEP